MCRKGRQVVPLQFGPLTDHQPEDRCGLRDASSVSDHALAQNKESSLVGIGTELILAH